MTDEEILESLKVYTCKPEVIDNAIKLKNAVEKIKDLVEGTIDHFDLEDAMDVLYDIKRVIKNTEGLI